jgi:hypothetical protein
VETLIEHALTLAQQQGLTTDANAAGLLAEPAEVAR